MRCFLGKFTQLTKILHDHRSRHGDKFQLCTAPHMMYICMYQTEKGPNEVNKFLFFGFVPMGKKKHLFRPGVELRGPQVLSTDFSLFKYCSLVFAILKSHFEFELDPSSVFVEQLKLWICCDFKDSRFSKQQVYSRLVWVLLKETNFFCSVLRQNYLFNVKRKIWLVLY